jgi:hypothetical protein
MLMGKPLPWQEGRTEVYYDIDEDVEMDENEDQPFLSRSLDGFIDYLLNSFPADYFCAFNTLRENQQDQTQEEPIVLDRALVRRPSPSRS